MSFQLYDIFGYVKCRMGLPRFMIQYSSSVYFKKAIFLGMLEPDGFNDLITLFHK